MMNTVNLYFVINGQKDLKNHKDMMADHEDVELLMDRIPQTILKNESTFATFYRNDDLAIMERTGRSECARMKYISKRLAKKLVYPNDLGNVNIYNMYTYYVKSAKFLAEAIRFILSTPYVCRLKGPGKDAWDTTLNDLMNLQNNYLEDEYFPIFLEFVPNVICSNRQHYDSGVVNILTRHCVRRELSSKRRNMPKNMKKEMQRQRQQMMQMRQPQAAPRPPRPPRLQQRDEDENGVRAFGGAIGEVRVPMEVAGVWKAAKKKQRAPVVDEDMYCMEFEVAPRVEPEEHVEEPGVGMKLQHKLGLHAAMFGRDDRGR